MHRSFCRWTSAGPRHSKCRDPEPLHFGEGSFPSVTLKECIGLLFSPVGLIIGLVLAWWKELLAAQSLLKALGYICSQLFMNRSSPKGPWFAVFAIPGMLFIT